MKRVALLGATGSIGRQALEIIDAHPALELAAAASGSQPIDGLAPLTQVGGDLTELLDRAEPDVVLNAVVGFAGLPATCGRSSAASTSRWRTRRASSRLASSRSRRGGEAEGASCRSTPSTRPPSSSSTAGRPRRSTRSSSPLPAARSAVGRARARDVTPAEALAHPTWNMGPKITVDSATLMNKGLELIEAHFLFDLPYDRIEVVVHPTSVVHALVRLRDGAALAHLGYPDMRVPISFALTYPERAATPIEPLDLAGGLILEFSGAGRGRLPLPRARAGGGRGRRTAPCVLNAANEVAVAAFLDGDFPSWDRRGRRADARPDRLRRRAAIWTS